MSLVIFEAVDFPKCKYNVLLLNNIFLLRDKILSDLMMSEAGVFVRTVRCSCAEYVDKFKLFIKNFDTEVTEKEIKALSPDILDVQTRKIYTKKRDKKGCVFFLSSGSYVINRSEVTLKRFIT